MTDLSTIRRRVDAGLQELALARRSISELKSELAEAVEHAEACLEGQKILQQLAASVQQTAHTQIANIVSKCLGTVFEDPYEFRVVFEEKRGKTEARLVFVKNGEEHEPDADVEGGVVDVAAFALRTAKLMMQKPRVRPVLFLDEAFRMVDRVNAGRVRGLLESLSEELNLQVIQVTHNPVLRAGKVVEL